MRFGKKKLKKTPTNDVVIAAASRLYDDSVRMFVEAEKKIDAAQAQLGTTIENIDAAIEGLLAQREKALTDQSRNDTFKIKLQEFTQVS